MDLYSTPLSLSSLYPICALPIRLDSYRGCEFQCRYCFARARDGRFWQGSVAPAANDALRKALFNSQSADRRLSVVGQFLQRKMPVHFGGMSDPFQPMEREQRVSLDFLRTLHDFEHPVVISTRSPLIATEPYLSLLKSMRVYVRLSLSTTLGKQARYIEKDAPSPIHVLRTAERLTNAGIPVSFRWQPFIPGTSESPESYISTIADTGAVHLSFEHLRLPREKAQKVRLTQAIQKTTGIDIYDFYKASGASNKTREYILPIEVRLPTVIDVWHIAKKNNLFLGVADNDLQYLSTTAACCSGIDKVRGFENWFKHQIGHVVRQSKYGVIRFDSLHSEWTPAGSIDRYLSSTSRIGYRVDNATLAAHLQHKWNRPNSDGSPSSFYGVIPTQQRDEFGNLIYEWDDNVRRAWVGTM